MHRPCLFPAAQNNAHHVSCRQGVSLALVLYQACISSSLMLAEQWVPRCCACAWAESWGAPVSCMQDARRCASSRGAACTATASPNCWALWGSGWPSRGSCFMSTQAILQLWLILLTQRWPHKRMAVAVMVQARRPGNDEGCLFHVGCAWGNVLVGLC